MSESAPDDRVEFAIDAVEQWDGQDTGDLIRLLAVNLGMSLFEVKGIVVKLMQEDTAAYAAACDTPIHPVAPGGTPTAGTLPTVGTEGTEDLG